MKPIAPIRSKDELKKVLALQRIIVQSARREMLAMASSDPARFVAAEKRLLGKYASYPTLSEFASKPSLTNMYKWGATFGTAALVGGLVLEEIKVLQPHFPPDMLRHAFFLLLKELHQPEHKYLADPLLGVLEVSTSALPEQARGLLVKELVNAFVLVSTQFGLMDSDGKRAMLTFTGKRVLMHLADADRFAEEIGKAHAKFGADESQLPGPK